MKSINPANGEVLHEYEAMNEPAWAGAIEKAHQAFLSWKPSSFAKRASLLRRAAQGLRSRKDDLRRLMAQEMGKPVAQGASEVDKCAWACEYYAEHGEGFLESQSVSTDASRSYVSFHPLGVVLAVMPWNFPFWQVFRFAAPALMAGNAAVLKHASNVSGCALEIERVFREAGFPEHVFRTLLVGSREVEKVIDHPRLVAVTLTGSTEAGRSVAQAAGRALKKTVLELGGSDPYVVLEDADIESAVETCVSSRLLNSGQSCISAKRFIVVDAVRSEFTEAFVERMKEASLGDPLDEDTRVGPQARVDLRDTLHDQVQRSVSQGARTLLGGTVSSDPGAWYPPTVLADVEPSMAAFDEETFGPVAALVAARNEEQAIELANRTSFGLGAAVFTKDRERGERIAQQRLQAGNCFVNSLVKSDPRLPFGGIKESGYGRELSHFGIREFANIKTVYVA